MVLALEVETRGVNSVEGGVVEGAGNRSVKNKKDDGTQKKKMLWGWRRGVGTTEKIWT